MSDSDHTRPFAAWLQEQNDGRLQFEVSTALRELVQALHPDRQVRVPHAHRQDHTRRWRR